MQLNISIEKCAVLHLGSYNKTFNNYNIDTVQLPNTCEVKDLGVTVDSMLTFKSHINNIVTKAHQRVLLSFVDSSRENLNYCSKRLLCMFVHCLNIVL